MEIELKIPLKAHLSPTDVISFLLHEYGGSSEEIRQTDYYFSSPIRNFAITDEALRIRQIQAKTGEEIIELTYKGPKLGESMKIREEITLETSNITDAKKFLQNLGFQIVAVIKKKRTNWSVNELTISVDEVEDLGSFLEIEILSPIDNSEIIHKSKEQIINLAKRILPNWSGEDERKSYLELLLAS
ncbi:MAG: class IV adenylate cyclase [Promethearchaeota archaeon]